MLKKIFKHFGYTLTKIKKNQNLDEIIKFRLQNNPCDLLIDIGANQGDFSKNYLNNFKELFLIEPNKNLINNLNLKFQKEKKVKIFNIGIDKIKSSGKFYITNDTGQTLSSMRTQTDLMDQTLKNSKIIKEVNVNFDRLDNIIPTKVKNIFLKTDTQGNELSVLESLGKFIEKTVFIKCEMPVLNLYNIDYSYWDILDFFRKNDFIPVFFDNGIRNEKGKLIEFDVIFERKKND